MSGHTRTAAAWTGLTGREHGHESANGASIVFLHGLSFDHAMWDPVIDRLPKGHRSIALDLPGHGGSPAGRERGLEPVVDAVHAAVVDAGIHAPIVVGHSIGGPLASLYAATHPARAVVSVEAPIRLEPFAGMLRMLRLEGDGFDGAWSAIRDGLRMDLLPADRRQLLRAGDTPSQQVILSYQADLLERPLEEVVRWRDDALRRLRGAGTPYLTLHSNPVDAGDLAWQLERLPQAESVVWPVGHHFPHLANPDAFAALLARVAATAPPVRREAYSG
jgi:pimeloyl-ACP methyl ester carboxylesterase